MSPAVVQHLPMVGLVPPSRESKSAGNQHPNGLKSVEIDDLICDALRAARLSHGQACAHIGNGKGKAYDQGQWTAARETGNLPFSRMWAGLPPEFWHHFLAALADAAGMRVSAPDQRVVALKQTAALVHNLANLIEEMTA